MAEVLVRHGSLVILEGAEGEPELREDIGMKVASAAEALVFLGSVECVEPLSDVVKL